MTKIIAEGLPRLQCSFYQIKEGQTSQKHDDSFKDSESLRILMLRKSRNEGRIFVRCEIIFSPYMWATSQLMPIHVGVLIIIRIIWLNAG